jgi:peptidoglycan/LPS O-acetylase OafA/YrhL
LIKLSAYTSGRNNNFNLIRLLAASAVLVSYSFTLSTGNPPPIEPFCREPDLTLGTIAVHIFFITSGFLVPGVGRPETTSSILFACTLRIYPGLWVSEIPTILVAGVLAYDRTLASGEPQVTRPVGVFRAHGNRIPRSRPDRYDSNSLIGPPFMSRRANGAVLRVRSAVVR